MSRLTLRVTIIDVEIPPGLHDELEAWICERMPDALIEVRRTVTSTPRQPDQG